MHAAPTTVADSVVLPDAEDARRPAFEVKRLTPEERADAVRDLTDIWEDGSNADAAEQQALVEMLRLIDEDRPADRPLFAHLMHEFE